MLKLAVMVSGGGTNLQAILDAINDGTISNTKLVRVISNNPNAYALSRAEKAGIPTLCITRKQHPDPEDFDRALLKLLQETKADLIALAGCLVLIPKLVVDAFPNRIINIHPALIPSFCGKGCYGLKVHEQALKRGVKVTGATVHFVDGGTDTGPIILQKAVKVKEDDTPETLQRRVMEEAEWKILPEAINLIANGKVRIEEGKVRISEDGT